jgi:NADH-quinone oxidoreductase subunit L
MAISTLIALTGIGLGYWLYGRGQIPSEANASLDVLERIRPDIFALLKHKYFIDEIYEASIVRFNAWFARACDWLDEWLWNGVVSLVSYVILGLSWVNRFFDEYVVNLGFEEACRRLTRSGGLLSRLQNGRVQNYLRAIGVGLTILVLVLIWGCHAPNNFQ